MAFLFGKKKQQQQYSTTPAQSKDGPGAAGAAPASSIPTVNGMPAGARDREKEGGPNQSPTPSGSLNNSINSLQNGGTPSPEQKALRDKGDLDFQVSHHPRCPP